MSITMVYTTPYVNPDGLAVRWAPQVHAPQLRLDFAISGGTRVGHAIILAMPGCAFVLFVSVDPPHRGRGFGLEIHRILAQRYGSVACEQHCSDDEMRVWEAMARRRDDGREPWSITLQPGPRSCGLPAITRSGAGVHEMIVGRLV